MARKGLTTTQRGYGAPHARKLKTAKANYIPGQLCPRCHQPIWPGQPVDLGHIDGTGKQAYSGLEHRHCKRSRIVTVTGLLIVNAACLISIEQSRDMGQRQRAFQEGLAK